ncbi:MAG TPA: toll/interleukin-1 receptor domain-containing protein [Allosphingosinicella sp.]
MRDRRAHIFLSYRRADSAAIVDHLYDRLVAKYGRDCIFRDIDDIPLGKDFRDHIRSVIGSCDIVLTIIGPSWHGRRGAANDRISRGDDPVRTEIEVALEAGALVIPLLVGGAEMPEPGKLPPTLQDLSTLNAATLGTGLDFEHHLGVLFKKLDEAFRLRGKAVVRRPEWLKPAAMGAGIVALTPLLLFSASALLAIPFGAGVVPVGIIIAAAAAALALTLFLVIWILSGRIGWALLRERPYVAGLGLFVVALPACHWLGSAFAEAIPIRDTPHLSRQLLVAFGEARTQLTSTGRGDFTEARRIVDAIREIDPQNGIGWYFAGEIERVDNPRLFDPKSCFRGWPRGTTGSLAAYQQDFLRYLETERELGEMTRITDWGTEVCYSSSGRGYCPQRTAWIYHLLANDSFIEAGALEGAARAERLEDARNHVRQALRYNRPQGGSGFTQCTDSRDLLRQIEAALEGPGEAETGQLARATTPR